MKFSYSMIALIAFATSLSVIADVKYNPYSGKFETVKPDSKPTYNPYSNTFEMAPAGSKPKYNPYSNSFEMMEPGAKPEYNPYNGRWAVPK